MGVVDSIFAHAAAAADRTAVIHNGRALSYGGFAALIGRARAVLARQAPRPDRVAVLCIDGLLDAWVAGLALRSLGVTTAHARSTGDIARLGLGAVSVAARRGALWPGLADAAAQAGWPLLLAPGAYDPAEGGAADPGPADIAGGHILLTSGTTGVYKKVLVDRAVEAWNRTLRAELYGFSADSVVNVFDFGGWTSVGHHLPACVWALGGAVAIHEGPERWRSLATPGLTLAYTQPQLLADLLNAPAQARLRNDAMTLIVTSGALPLAQWRAARERLTADVRTCIGSTEAGVVTITPIETAEDLAWHRIHPACEVQVVDDLDLPVAPGRTGVVRVRSIGVDGYLDDPAASAAFFRGGFFYPGDLGALREDGRLTLLGRVTEVINLMGDKLPAAPIERTLQDRLGAEGVCVFSAPGPDGEVVHVALQLGRIISPEALRSALAEALPGVAEARAHAVRALPRNHMGKIDRAALRRMLLGDGGGG